MLKFCRLLCVHRSFYVREILSQKSPKFLNIVTIINIIIILNLPQYTLGLGQVIICFLTKTAKNKTATSKRDCAKCAGMFNIYVLYLCLPLVYILSLLIFIFLLYPKTFYQLSINLIWLFWNRTSDRWTDRSYLSFCNRIIQEYNFAKSNFLS